MPALRAVLAALALASAAPARAGDQVLSYALASDVDTLDPAWAYDATSLFVIQQVYEGLVEYEGTSLDRFAPRLAAVVPTTQNGFLSGDGLTWRFPLRRGVKFHDGTEMTAEDVKYSLLRFLLTDRDGGPSALLLEPLIGRRTVAGPGGKPDPAVFALVDRAVAAEGGALVLRLSRPFAPLLHVLAGFAPVVSKKAVIARGGWDGSRETWTHHYNPPKTRAALHSEEAGTGPFRLTAWDRASRRLLLARHEGYWRRRAPLAGARLLIVEDARERRRLLETGEADVAQVDQRTLPFFESVPGGVVDKGLPLLEVDNVILFNLNAEPRDNPWLGSGKLDGQGVPPDFFAEDGVRAGFAFAFDYDRFIREGFGGSAVRARGPIPLSLLPRDMTRQLGRSYSIEEAAKALKGPHGGRLWSEGFLLPVAYEEGRADRRLACRLLEEGLAKANPRFRVDCRPLPQSRLLEELRARRLAAFVYRWILDYPDPHNAVEPFLSSRGYFGERLGYVSARADSMIEAAIREPDAAKRLTLYSELRAIASYDVPQIFTAEATGALARRAKVAVWPHHPMQPYGTLYEADKLP